jgi:hypothetical protein
MSANLALVQPHIAVPSVYGAIAAVSADIAKVGISKDRTNTQQGFKFRGIDDVLNALSPLLARHKLIILPRVLSRTQTERATAKGGVLFSVVVDAEFDFISAEDGSRHTVRTFGEGMDSADKATNKAMSTAYKYAAFQAFCIPVEGALDEGDKDHHDVAPRGAQAQPPHVDVRTGEEVGPPAGYDDWLIDMLAVADNGLDAMRDAWKKSRREFCDYARGHDLARLTEKAKGAK